MVRRFMVMKRQLMFRRVKGDKKSNTPYDIVKEVHSSEARIATTFAHNFQVSEPVLEVGTHTTQVQFTPAEPTAETFALYKRYQMAVHGDPEAKVTPRAFARFLCGSPIVVSTKIKHIKLTRSLDAEYSIHIRFSP
jgi:arginyl-tRNA--protein-N-Asp/Glu arginylyltransferase